MLTSDQLYQIQTAVDSEGITIPTLRDDLIDHICCSVEEQINNGVQFQQALQSAIAALGENGLSEIQTETIKVLNYKTVVMKKMSFVVGLLCAVIMLAGFVLSLFHLPMGHMLFGLAAFAFVLFFVPLDAIRQLRFGNHSFSEKLSNVLSSSSTLLLATGVVSNILLLPGANEMIVIGLIIFVAGFLPMQFYKMYREAFS